MVQREQSRGAFIPPITAWIMNLLFGLSVLGIEPATLEFGLISALPLVNGS
jgi:hypothetical protein